MDMYSEHNTLITFKLIRKRAQVTAGLPGKRFYSVPVDKQKWDAWTDAYIYYLCDMPL